MVFGSAFSEERDKLDRYYTPEQIETCLQDPDLDGCESIFLKEEVAASFEIDEAPLIATKWGCPNGAVCMYTLSGWYDDIPQHKFYSYGYHALYNEWGERVVFNNQYATPSGRAGAYTCTAKSSTSCGSVITMGDFKYVDINPINYIKLTASGG